MPHDALAFMLQIASRAFAVCCKSHKKNSLTHSRYKTTLSLPHPNTACTWFARVSLAGQTVSASLEEMNVKASTP